jgi:hypothetical protein
MRPSIIVGLFCCVVVGTTAIGCRDGAPAEPQAFDNREAKSGGAGGSDDDSSSTPEPSPSTAPVEPGPGPDTAVAPLPPAPASFTIDGVALGVEPGSDTTRTVRVAGVAARLYRVRAADGSTIAETLVASATADANGQFVFRDVSSAHYRLNVQAPAGGPYADGSVSISPPWSTPIRVAVMLHRRP